MSAGNTQKGRVAAVDLGKTRVGVAISDELGLLAFPREPLDGRKLPALLAELRALAQKEGVSRFIVGLPLLMSGAEGPAARRAIRFAQRLTAATGIEVELLDERLTTVQAEQQLRALVAGSPQPSKTRRRAAASRKQLRGRVDGVAAALILQTWLDQRQPAG